MERVDRGRGERARRPCARDRVRRQRPTRSAVRRGRGVLLSEPEGRLRVARGRSDGAGHCGDHLRDDVDVTLFALRPFADAYPDLVQAVPTVVCPIGGRSKAVRILAEGSWLAVQARRHRIDVLHHAGGTVPLLRATPSLLTIHDLQPLLLPDNFSRAKQWYLRWRLPASARRAGLVVTLTEYTRTTIVERLGVPRQRIEIVAPGYTATLAEQSVGDPRARHGITGPFF